MLLIRVCGATRALFVAARDELYSKNLTRVVRQRHSTLSLFREGVNMAKTSEKP